MSGAATASRNAGAAAIDRFVAAFERRFGAGTAEPSWLADARRRAIARFSERGFPTTRDEEWKFTSLGPFLETSFELSAGMPAVAADRIAPFSLAGEAAAEIVFVNGHFAPALSRLDRVSQGLRVEPLKTVLAVSPERLEDVLSRPGFNENAAFTALNAAFVGDGAVVTVAAHAVVEHPIHVVFITTGAAAAQVTFPRLVVKLGEDSQARLVETYAGLENGISLTNAVTELILGSHAVLDHARVQQESFRGYHVGTQHVRAEASSTLVSQSFAFGGAIVRNEIVAVLGGEGIDCTLNGLYLGGGTQLIDNHTTIDHAMPHCGSHELYKGILAGQARGVFNGKIVVRQDAQKTDAKQTNRALLLSDEAQINSKPQLEIFANDVKCTHGATIGQLDEDAVFYLRARGLGLDQARSLLIHAFAREVLDRVRVETVRARLGRALERQLNLDQD
jgi:Fe-S cluster assembly protein SufD